MKSLISSWLAPKPTPQDMASLDALLHSRRFEEPSYNLAERIMADAAVFPRPVHVHYSAKTTLPALGDIVRTYFAPVPALACACLLMTGVFMGRENSAASYYATSTITTATNATSEHPAFQDWGAL